MTSADDVQARDARRRVLEELAVVERRREVGGVPTSVLEGGEGQPLVLLHGGIQAGGVVWWRVLPSLLERHRIVVPDLPGVGESDAPRDARGLDAVPRWLDELIAATFDEPTILVAHSAPSALAMRFALGRSERIRRLVLVDPGGLARGRLPPLGLLLAAVRSTARPSERSFHRFMARVMHDLDAVRASDPAWPSFARYAAARAARASVKRTMRRLAKLGLRGAIPTPELARARVPVSLVWGRQDPLTPLTTGQALSAALGWPLHVIERSGHLPHVEQPQRFVETLSAAIGAPVDRA